MSNSDYLSEIEKGQDALTFDAYNMGKEILRRRHKSTGTDVSGATGGSLFPFANQSPCDFDVDDVDYRTESENILSRSFHSTGHEFGHSPVSQHNVYRTPVHRPVCTRSLSAREGISSGTGTPVGPHEFLELYHRNRANTLSGDSDRQQLARRARRRRTYSSGSGSHISPSSSTYSEFEPRNYVLWKDAGSGFRCFRLPSTCEEIPVDITKVDNANMCVCFLKSWTCYDVMPSSSKLTVFDTRLTLRQSFFALWFNGIRAAPLWDTNAQGYVGMLTVTDYLKMLLNCRRMKRSNMSAVEAESLASWKENQRLVSVSPDTSLQAAMNTICLNKIHWLPIVEPISGNMLHILTYSHLLRHLYNTFKHHKLRHPPFFSKKLEELNVGTFNNLAVIYPETPLHIALDLLLTRRLSAIPVVNKSGGLCAVYAKSDVMDLAAQNAHNDLSITVGKLIDLQHTKKPITCHKTDTLYDVMEQTIINNVQRLIVVSSAHKVIGVVSVSDIIRCVVYQTNISQELGFDEDNESLLLY